MGRLISFWEMRLKLSKRSILALNVTLLLSCALLILVFNTVFVLYNYLFNSMVQYVFLFLVLSAASILVLKKALLSIELERSREEAPRVEGQLTRLSRRLFLASRGFAFTQDMLRRRLKRLFEEQHIEKSQPIASFLDTPIEGRSRQRRRGDEYMKLFSEAVGILEERS